MKGAVGILSIVLLLQQIFCAKSLKPIEIDQDVSALSEVFNNIVDEFFLKPKTKFGITLYKISSSYLNDIVDKFLLKMNGKFPYRIESFGKFKTQQHLFIPVFYSQILFAESFESFCEIIEMIFPVRDDNQPINCFVFIPNLTFSQLESSEELIYFEELELFTVSFFYSIFFIIVEQQSLNLISVEYFSPKLCNKAHLKILNSFDIKSRKWNSKLENYEKFLQYHGCELTLMVPVIENGINNHVSSYAILSAIPKYGELPTFKIYGIAPALFEIASKHHNFTAAYQPAIVAMDFLMAFDKNYAQPIMTKYYYKIPTVFFEMASLQWIGPSIRMSNIFVNLKSYIFVTPAKAYTQYEKIFLPFDKITWILLICTFCATFLSISLINRLPKSSRDLIYGSNVDTPLWNVISIFFGISQTRLPSKFVPQFILLLFIYFCLIFRTCFQSKFFEFMTSQPRPSPPKTLYDLNEKKYTTYSSIKNRLDEYIIDEIGRRLNITYKGAYEYEHLYSTQSQNESGQLSLLVDEFFLNDAISKTRESIDWNKIDDYVPYIFSEGFGFQEHSFYFRMLKGTIDRLIDTGVMNYLVENFYTRKLKFEISSEGPKVLSLEDLSFGFQIWLGFCCLSTVTFAIEKIYFVVKRSRKVQFAKIYPLDTLSYQEPKSATLEKFRVKKNEEIIQDQDNSSGLRMVVNAEVHENNE